MAQKPENTFIVSVNKHLPETYFEKTNNPFRSGIADVWYSGVKGDLWVEYKFVESLPRSQSIQPDLSPRQLKWLGDRFDEGRNVMVILGTRTGGIIYEDLDWERDYTEPQLVKRIRPRPDLALYILDKVGKSKCKLRDTRRSSDMQLQ